MLHFRMDMPFGYMALYGSVMIVAVLGLRALLRSRLPKFVFPVLWGVVLLRLLVPFSISSPLSLPVPFSGGSFLSLPALALQGDAFFEEISAEAQEGRAASVGTAEQSEVAVSAVQEEEGYRNILPVLYFLGLAAMAAILGWQKYRYAGRLRESLLIEHNETVNAMLRDMDMGHVLVFTNDSIASPLVSGLLNPRIYLPTGMDFANTVLLGHVLAHEAMHVRRRDNWLKCAMLAALAVNWYNPLVWIMSKCLASDLEAACDAAVLGKCSQEERKSYAYSLLAMAITGSRSTLLYSAFSKTEVEKRVKGIIRYRKATALALAFSVLFLLGSTAVLATGGQAPFSTYLTGFCFSSSSSWGVRVALARDIALGENPQERAEDTVFLALNADATGDPEILEESIRAALAEEFGVERRAFLIDISLCRDEEELDEEYAPWGLVRGEDGMWLYQGERIRVYEDRMLGSFQSHEDGSADISVQRDRMGKITDVTVWRKGDREYDERTGSMWRSRRKEGSDWGALPGYSESAEVTEGL